MKKLLFILTTVALLTSCSHENIDAQINDNLIIEQIKLINTDENGIAHYVAKIQTVQGRAYYYTTYRHEAGDTLLSIYEFSDSRGKIAKRELQINDSIKVDLDNALEKINELTLYNEMLSKVAFDKMKNEYK